MKNSRKSWLGGLSAAAVALTMVGAGAGAALAAPQPGNIDPDAEVSLTVEKKDQDKDPLEGATFQPCEVLYNGGSVDLGDPSMWALVTDLNTTIWGSIDHELPGDPWSLGDCLDEKTTAEGTGTATWNSAEGMTQGVWYLTETEAPEGYRPALPFITTVPRSLTDGTWQYDVTVDPKNLTETLEKVPSVPEGYGIGSKVTWTVRSSVFNPSDDSEITSWHLTDKLDSRLSYVETTSVKIDGTTLVACDDEAGTTPLGCDYFVKVEGQTVRMMLTAGGLALLNANENSDIEWVYTTEVVSVSEEGLLENTVEEFVNDPDEEGTSIPSTSSTTNWGDLEIEKTGDDVDNTALEGAQFQVFATAQEAADCVSEVRANKGTLPGGCHGAVLVSGTDIFTSDDTGLVDIPGLWVGNDDVTEKTYYVVEIVAPAGFVNAHLGTQGAWTPTVEAGTTSGFDISIENSQQPPTTLPNTGAVVSGILVIAAIALGGGCIFLIASSRRKANQA